MNNSPSISKKYLFNTRIPIYTLTISAFGLEELCAGSPKMRSIATRITSILVSLSLVASDFSYSLQIGFVT